MDTCLLKSITGISNTVIIGRDFRKGWNNQRESELGLFLLAGWDSDRTAHWGIFLNSRDLGKHISQKVSALLSAAEWARRVTVPCTPALLKHG